MRRVAALIVLGFLLGGCDEFAALNAPSRELTVSALTPADAEIAEKVLQARFHRHLPYLRCNSCGERAMMERSPFVAIR